MNVDPDSVAPDDSYYDPRLRLWTDPQRGERTALTWMQRVEDGRLVEQWAEPVPNSGQETHRDHS